MTTTNYGATCATIDGEFTVTHVFPVPADWDGYRFSGYCRPTAEEIRAAGFETDFAVAARQETNPAALAGFEEA